MFLRFTPIMSQEKKISLIESMQLIGSTFLFFYASLLCCTAGLFLVGKSLPRLMVPLALLLSGLYYLIVGPKWTRLGWKALLIGAAMIALVFVINGLIADYFYDLSWDGRDYHQKAIHRLAEGFNPVYNEQEPTDVYYNMWLNHYPKGPWIVAAAFYKLTGEIEIGKCTNLLMMAAIIFTAGAYLLTFRLKLWEATLVSLVLVANPVSVYQSLSYYVDGQVASLYVLIGIWGLMVIQKPSYIAFISLACAIIVGLNIKFTATVYIIFLLAVLFLAHLYLKRSWLAARPFLLVAILGSLLGVLFVGFNPYITNSIRYHNPFYPIYSHNKFNQNFIAAPYQFPANYVGVNSLKKLLLSTFSPSQNTTEPVQNYKNPFSISKSEISIFRSGVDVRVGGFGPFFGGLVILTVVTMAILACKNPRGALTSGAAVFIIFITAIINPEAWWARYAPQLWLIPAVVLVAALLCTESRLVQNLGRLMMVIALVNIFLISRAYFTGNLFETQYVRSTLQMLSERGDEILIYHGVLDAIETKLEGYHIHYKVVKNHTDLPCPQELEPFTAYSLKTCQ